MSIPTIAGDDLTRRALAAARETRRLEIGAGLLNAVPAIFQSQFGPRPAAIVADANTFPAPRAVVADLGVIAAAPPALNAAGYGALLAKVTAGADWIIADALDIDPIDPPAWDLVQVPLRDPLAAPAGVRRGDRDAVAK